MEICSGLSDGAGAWSYLFQNEKISAVNDIFCQQHGRCNSIYVQLCSDLSFSCSHCKHMALAVIVCDGKDTMSVRVPDGFLELHRSFKIHSKQFVYETLIGWGLNPEKTYSFKGEYLEEQKMVVFSLKNTD